MSERVTVTLKRAFLQEIDKLVDHVRVRSRSHFVELAVREYLERRTPAEPDPLEDWLRKVVEGQPSNAVREHDLVA